MNEFTMPLTLAQMAVPFACTGALVLSTFMLAYLGFRTGDRLYLSTAVMSLFGLLFVGSEMALLGYGSWLRNAGMGMQFHRTEQVAGAFFIMGFPFFIHYLLRLGPRWRRVNRLLVWVCLGISVFFALIAFAKPDLYISVTSHRPDWLSNQSNHGRGQEGMLYALRDLALGIVIIYGLICVAVNMVKNRRFGELATPLAGILLAVYGALVDTLHVHTGVLYDPTPDISYSRFTLGITLFILFSLHGVVKRFIAIGREAEEARRKADMEAGKNLKQNNFIKEVLSQNAQSLAESTKELSGSMAGFTDNTREQASATEEVSASIEEITAGIDTVAAGAGNQNRSLSDLSTAIEDLTETIKAVEKAVGDTLSMMNLIADSARAGKGSLTAMEESMETIRRSSGEMTSIVQIINDISDRVNLLSLNVAIEAARAGEHGRGFAVVADEISKLADQTTASIKSIDLLIGAGEKEILNGSGKVSEAVGNVEKIIDGIDSIRESIAGISDLMIKQAGVNRVVTAGARDVMTISDSIVLAMSEQKNAMEEIAGSIAMINETSQRNSLRINEITDFAGGLVERVSDLNARITDFGEEES
ncbi:MAG TPA: hypothetical protein ENN21_01805 [Spirochaetes bacterium]|nr:hypothetical protein [Spirochaetota bacterium]